MRRVLIGCALGLLVGNAVAASDVETIDRKMEPKGGGAVTQSPLKEDVGYGGPNILSSVVGAAAAEGYSLTLSGAAKGVVLNVISAPGSKKLKLVKTETNATLKEWTIDAKTSEAERGDIVKQISAELVLSDQAGLKPNSAGQADAKKN